MLRTPMLLAPMLLSTPVWLLLLLPWGALALWLFRGRLATQPVPFLRLWLNPNSPDAAPRSNWHIPPLSILSLLAAIFLAIFAAATPLLRPSAAPSSITAAPPDLQIQSIALRNVPTTQAMIGILNQSELQAATLKIDAPAIEISQPVTLPTRNQSKDYFLDLPHAAAEIAVELVAPGIDRRGRAGAPENWPLIQPRGALPSELLHMIAVYARLRPPADNAPRITILAAAESIPPTEPAAILSPATTVLPAHLNLLVRDSPITRGIDWPHVLAGASAAPPPVPAWQPLLTANGAPLLASRSDPIRQVWVGFRSANFSHHSDFVVFWTAVFNWLARLDDLQPTPGAAAIVSPAASPASDRPISAQLLLSAMILVVFSALLRTTPNTGPHNEFKS